MTAPSLRLGDDTVCKVHIDVVASNVGRHGDDGGRIELSNQMTGRDAVEVGHDDVHQDQVIFGSAIHLVDRFQTVKL